jgi:hypothetical protein
MGDLMMRAAIVLVGCFLISSSAFAVEPQYIAKKKPVVAAALTKGATTETPVAEGSLEKFGASGLPQ